MCGRWSVNEEDIKKHLREIHIGACHFYGAEGGNRTHTSRRTLDFESHFKGYANYLDLKELQKTVQNYNILANNSMLLYVVLRSCNCMSLTTLLRHQNQAVLVISLLKDWVNTSTAACK